MSIRDISDVLHIGKTTVYYHARDYCRKMTKLDSKLLGESEKGYIIGLFLGDGSLNRGAKIPRYIVRFALDEQRDQDIAEKVVHIFEKAHKKSSVFNREKVKLVKVCSKELVQYIQAHIEYTVKDNNQKEKKLILDKSWSLAFQYGVLAGIIDSDGHVHKHLGVEIKTTSILILKSVLALLNNLGIVAKLRKAKPTKNSYSKKTCYVIYIPSLQTKTSRDDIPSVKIMRFSEKHAK